MSFGKKLKRLREEQGLSIRELSEEIGIPASTLGSYEQTGTGARNPKKNNLKKLADYFGVTTDYLLEHEESYVRAEDNESYVKVAKKEIADIACTVESIKMVVEFIDLGDEDYIYELLPEITELIEMLEQSLGLNEVLLDEMMIAAERANTKNTKAKIYNMLGERVDD